MGDTLKIDCLCVHPFYVEMEVKLKVGGLSAVPPMWWPGLLARQPHSEPIQQGFSLSESRPAYGFLITLFLLSSNYN